MKLPRRRPRYADVAATLALVIALGGTAYAVTQIDPDSVYTDAIQDKAVTAAKLHNNAVNSARVLNGSIASVDIADESITSDDLAADSVTNSELGADAVTGAKVLANSLSLSDLLGADAQGQISFSLGANACGTVTYGVAGAKVGEVVLMSYTGNVALPDAVVFGLARVTSANHISQRACNVSGTPVNVSNIGVRFVTFG
jgi:hypothetical protein